MVAAFASPKAAVDAAVAAQRALELPVLAPLHADQKRKYRRCSKNEQSPCISKTRPGANCARNASRLAQADTNLASDLIASGATTQSIDTVMAVLVARRNGASINAAAKASGINCRTAQRCPRRLKTDPVSTPEF